MIGKCGGGEVRREGNLTDGEVFKRYGRDIVLSRDRPHSCTILEGYITPGVPLVVEVH